MGARERSGAIAGFVMGLLLMAIAYVTTGGVGPLHPAFALGTVWLLVVLDAAFGPQGQGFTPSQGAAAMLGSAAAASIVAWLLLLQAGGPVVQKSLIGAAFTGLALALMRYSLRHCLLGALCSSVWGLTVAYLFGASAAAVDALLVAGGV